MFSEAGTGCDNEARALVGFVWGATVIIRALDYPDTDSTMHALQASLLLCLSLTAFSHVFASEPLKEKSRYSSAIEAYAAEPGGNLPGSPKIRPDGMVYFLSGKIQFTSETEPSFLATLSPSQENELLASALKRARGMVDTPEYFAVIIPDSLKNYYFDNATIGGGFDVIGHYVSNTSYETVLGQKKKAPVFEAVYFDLWSKRQVGKIDIYKLCMENAADQVSLQMDCAVSELEKQKARLDSAYKAALERSKAKEPLKVSQSNWLKQRQKDCTPDEGDDDGRLGAVNEMLCEIEMNSARSAELELTK